MMLRALSPSSILVWRTPLRHFMGSGTSWSSSRINIPHHIHDAARQWHNVQRRRQQQENTELYDAVVMGYTRKRPSQRQQKLHSEEQAQQNKRELLVQKWIWDEHVDNGEVFEETMRIDRDERHCVEEFLEEFGDFEEFGDSISLDGIIKEVICGLEQWPFAARDYDTDASVENNQSYVLVERIAEEMPSPALFNRVIRPQFSEWITKKGARLNPKVVS